VLVRGCLGGTGRGGGKPVAVDLPPAGRALTERGIWARSAGGTAGGAGGGGLFTSFFKEVGGEGELRASYLPLALRARYFTPPRDGGGGTESNGGGRPIRSDTGAPGRLRVYGKPLGPAHWTRNPWKKNSICSPGFPRHGFHHTGGCGGGETKPTPTNRNPRGGGGPPNGAQGFGGKKLSPSLGPIPAPKWNHLAGGGTGGRFFGSSPTMGRGPLGGQGRAGGPCLWLGGPTRSCPQRHVGPTLDRGNRGAWCSLPRQGDMWGGGGDWAKGTCFEAAGGRMPGGRGTHPGPGFGPGSRGLRPIQVSFGGAGA